MPAQGVRVTGRVLVGGPEPHGTPLDRGWAVLHRVDVAGGAPIDSARTDRGGWYVLTVGQVDTTAIYLVSAGYHGITYFTSAVRPDTVLDTIAPLVVFDTSSTAPPIIVNQRHMVVRAPEEDGGRRVLELVVLGNVGTLTRVSPDAAHPVWSGPLPEGAVQFEVGESEVSAQAVARRGDTVDVTAPLPPGEKQLLFTYTIPAGAEELVVPVGERTLRFNILLEDTAAALVSGELDYRGVQVLEDAQFAMYEASAPLPGSRPTFAFSRSRFSIQRFWGALVVLAVVSMIATLLFRARRSVVRPQIHPQSLAREIAALDAAYEARAPAARNEAAYRAERARLKERLQAVLASGQARR